MPKINRLYPRNQMPRNKRYITTPIYYVNDVPHIGHAYTTIAADILARYYRLKGDEVFFITGTDEHGQKVEQAAEKKGMSAKEHADSMIENFSSLWKKLKISNDNFIRTTDDQHKEVVQTVLQELFDKGEIVKRSYSGWYCTPDERFWTEKDLKEGNCPECGRPVEEIQEENYFFLMSNYKEDLIRHIENHPSFILPETRKNEVLGFLQHNELGDLCISRPKSRLSWGVELPFDNDFVTYVWFDALLNYYSATEYLAHKNDSSFWWPAEHHIIGKDILTTHAVYWSTMLLALQKTQDKNEDKNKWSLPGNIFAHGWWTVEGKKMSKSVGNVVDPNTMADKYGVDAFRFFLFREVPFGLDGDFSEEALVKRLNTELANDLGNLLSRTLTMIGKYNDGVIPEPVEPKDGTTGKELKFHFNPDVNEIPSDFPFSIPNNFEDYLSRLEFNHALSILWGSISAANKYINTSEPWKEKDKDTLSNVLYNLAESLRLIAIYLYPFMPDTANKIWQQLGLAIDIQDCKLAEIENWGMLKPGIKTKIGDHLFERINTKKDKKEKKKVEEKTEVKKEESKADDNLITIKDFAKVELKIGIILEAEKIEKSDKLLRLQVDTGEKRQLVAGIALKYTPEELVGKKVVVVTNLKPAKLMGVESQGMLLAATDSDGVLSILTPEKDIKEGATIR